MTQHGETPTSSATLPSQGTGSIPETFHLQKGTVDKCLEIVQQFRADKISKLKATLLLQQTIPHESVEEESFVSAYGSYLNMLDNFEQYQTGAGRRIDETRELLGGNQSGERRDGSEHPEQEAHIAGPSKRARSPSGSSDEGDEDYKR